MLFVSLSRPTLDLCNPAAIQIEPRPNIRSLVVAPLMLVFNFLLAWGSKEPARFFEAIMAMILTDDRENVSLNIILI